jgi:ribosomal protein S18 acetylase RimI-like enzyme
MTALTFRAAAQADVDGLAAFVNAAYRGDSSKRGWTTEADLLDGQRTDEGKLAEMIADGRVELGFDGDGLLAACVYLRKEASGDCYLGMLTVDPGRQNEGLGRSMLAHAEQVARASGCARMRMTVIDLREELIAWYERRGYARTGKTEPFPSADPRFGVPKVADLRFCELVKSLGLV